MEFEDKQTSEPAEPVENAGSNRQFLQSMGFGEEDLGGLDGQSEKDSKDEVALSSLPEDLELPGGESKSPIGPRVIGVQIGNTSHQVSAGGKIDLSPSRVSPESEAKELTPDLEKNMEESTPAPESHEVPEREVDIDDPNLLHLNCPSCDGELVLRKEHVGVEGACVWCDMKIVAARSGFDGGVKIFALEAPKVFYRKEEKTGEAPIEALAEDEPIEEVPEEVVTSGDDEKETEELPTIEADAPSLTDETEEGDIASSWDLSAAVGPHEAKESDLEESKPEERAFEGWSGMAAPASDAIANEDQLHDGLPSEIPNGFYQAPLKGTDEAAPQSLGENSSVDPDSAPSPWGSDFAPDPVAEVDLESAFDSPSTESLSHVGLEDLDFAPTPLEESAPQADSEMMEAFSPSPFSGDTPPSGEHVGPAPEVNGFETASGELFSADEGQGEEPLDSFFGSSPSEGQVKTQTEPDDASPSAMSGFGAPAASSADATDGAWEGSIGSSESPSIELAPLPLPEEPFSSAAQGTESNEGGAEPAPGFSMDDSNAFSDSAPVPVSMPAPKSDLEAGFALPAPIEENETFNDGFQIPTATPQGFGVASAGSQEEATAPISSTQAQAVVEEMSFSDSFAAPVDSDASEEDSPFFLEGAMDSRAASAFSEPPAPESPIPMPRSETEASPFEEVPASEPSPSPFAEAANEVPAAQEGVADATPAVSGQEAIPQLLASSDKKKKKKSKTKGPRKGLVVLLVILIGFVCGAALASFVLPVDQYILKARAYMDEKFNPGGAVLNQDLLPSRVDPPIPTGDSQP